MPFNKELSHRGYNLRCNWWSRKDNSFEYEPQPNGFFYAKEFNEKQLNRDNFMGNGMIMMDRETINLKTPDNLSDIKTGDKVCFEDEVWFVGSVNRKRARNQQAEFTNYSHANYYWILSLRK